MITRFYLVVNERGLVKTFKKSPDLKFNEVSIELRLELPNSLFTKPILSGVIQVSDDMVNPPVITPDIQQDIQNAIKNHAGVEVKLEIQDSQQTILDKK